MAEVSDGGDPFVQRARAEFEAKGLSSESWTLWLRGLAFSRVEEAHAYYAHLLRREGVEVAVDRFAVGEVQETAEEFALPLTLTTTNVDIALNYEGYEAEARAVAAQPYADYLASDLWALHRRVALKRAKHRCQVCNRRGPSLQVHHRTYENRGDELLSDLIVLCGDCHKAVHQHGGAHRPKALTR